MAAPSEGLQWLIERCGGDVGELLVVVEVVGETEELSTDIASEDSELADDECYAVQKVVSDLVDSVVQYDVQSNYDAASFDNSTVTSQFGLITKTMARDNANYYHSIGIKTMRPKK